MTALRLGMPTLVELPGVLTVAERREAMVVIETKTVEALSASVEALKARRLA